MYYKNEMLRNPQLYMESENCKRNPQIVKKYATCNVKLHFLSQTVHLVNCKRIRQQAKIRFVAEPATFQWSSLLRSATFLRSSLLFWIPQIISETIVLPKILPKLGKIAESATVFAEFRAICEIHKQIIRHVYN